MATIIETYKRNGETILEHRYVITGDCRTDYQPKEIAQNTEDWIRVMTQDGCKIFRYTVGIHHVFTAVNDEAKETSYLSIM